MDGLLCYGLFVHLIMLVSSQNNDTYSDQFIMKTNLSEADVKAVAARNGFELKKKVFDGYFILKTRENVPRMSNKRKQLPANNTLKRHPMIEIFEQEKYLKRYKRQTLNTTSPVFTDRMVPKAISQVFTITDDHWKDMWYLHKDQFPSMGIYKVWPRGFTGSGVTVAFLDDGVETKHSDLSDNLRLDLSYDFIYDSTSPEHSLEDTGHGTSCAGIVSAVKNNFCVLGVAYNTNFAAIRILDNTQSIPESSEAMALVHKLDSVDIYSNSWGPSDAGNIFGGPTDIEEAALTKGVLYGRGGKGAIYVWAAGNGNDNNDDCNCDGFANSIYTITIGSLSNLRKPAFYSEPCTAVMATTYGGDYPNPMIVTTNRSNTCTTDFQGTSASAPVATGIIALTLEANPDLTWRDVMHVIVETSSNTNLIDPEGFIVNGAGKKVSRYNGFGLMNADAMITRAMSWKTVPNQFRLKTREITPSPSQSYSKVASSTRISSDIKYVEHVTVKIVFRVRTRGHAIFYLTSPQGTRCKLLGSRSNDVKMMYHPEYFTFSSVQTWGEDPTGQWKLEMLASGYFEEVELVRWVLTIYGTVTDPLRRTPADTTTRCYDCTTTNTSDKSITTYPSFKSNTTKPLGKSTTTTIQSDIWRDGVNSAEKSLSSISCFLNCLNLLVTSWMYSF